MHWIDPADCLAARECLHQGHVLEAARRLLASPHREHRAARQLLLEISDRLIALAAQDFERGEILVAWEAITCAEQCAALQGKAAALKERLTRARDARKDMLMSAEADLTAVYCQRFAELCGYLKRKFPRLTHADCEDLAQLAYVETLQKIHAREGFEPNKDWWSWLCWLASKRALDYLRQHEIASFDALAGRQPPAAGASPSAVLAEAERRGRQGLTLSEILTEYCRRCEARPEMLKQKEVYERCLRGQKPAAIAAAMGMERGTVDVHLKRARDWILQRVRQTDVDQSVFLTLHRRKPAE